MYKASFEKLLSGEQCLAVVGLGYVGLPLAAALSSKFTVIGLDSSTARIQELRNGQDRTGELAPEKLRAASIEFSAQATDLQKASLIIVAVPTPIDGHKAPDLRPVIGASTTVGKNLTRGAVVVYESTVYPGVTEDVCVPILERESGLKCGTDFTVGYSPERINPGDKVHTVENIVKVVSGSDAATADLLEKVYGGVIKAGIHRAPSIKVAEAAKVIENTQRDLNIALMNELSIIFNILGIDTLEVLEAAGTKWNFLPFRPGLVGGHCIGVDPYYLTYKAEEAGYHPQVILAGRRINDSMGKYVAENAVKLMIQNDCRVKGARVGILGLTFKENVPDLRNTRVTDIIKELESYGVNVLVHDPHVDKDEARREYGIEMMEFEELKELDALIVAVGHEEFGRIGLDSLKKCSSDDKCILLDIKGLYDAAKDSESSFIFWRL